MTPQRLARFQGPMCVLVQTCRGLDLRAFEIASVERIVGELQPATLGLLRDAKALLGAVLDSCRRLSPPEWIAEEALAPSAVWNGYLPFERVIDATVASRLGSHQAVDEIAFIAQLELRQREERLERVRPAQGTLALLGECDSSLRRIRKAFNAVDAAIARVELVAPLLDFTSELQTSLSVRRAYAKLRARVMADGEPTPETIRARLRGAGTQIAILVGWDVYTEMRVQDRLLIRDLQQRMLAWLRGGSGAATAAGLRIWQDLAACMEIFSLVNRRQELVEHDGIVVRALGERFAVNADPADADAAWAELRALDGLDPELDELLGRSPPPPIDAAKPVVTRLACCFGAATPTPGSAGDLPW